MVFEMGFKLTPMLGKPSIEKFYDVVVVGAGPAGLSGALYLARYGLKTIIVSKTIGGKVALAPLVDDYLGLPETPGAKLVDLFVKHVAKFNIPILVDEVTGLSRNGDKWVVETKSSGLIECYATLLAVGSTNRKLGVPGEEEFVGRGVSYCATCDGPLFKNKVVAVVGGGNSALVSALYLSTLASKVYLIHRRNEFRAFPFYVDKAYRTGNIEVILNTVVLEIMGRDRVEAIRIKNIVDGLEKEIGVNGVFIEIGSVPPREFFEKIGVEVDENGYAKVNVDMSTNLPGVYVAGDAAGGPCKYRFEQISTAVAEGAIAADSIYKYLHSVRR